MAAKKLRVYSYAGCGTCKKALKYLQEKEIDYDLLAIREQPPTQNELKKMLKYYAGNIKRLFNSSGQDYRAMNMKDKLKSASEKELIELLSKNGNLVKRPFVLSQDNGLVGFKVEEWEERL